MHLHRWIYTCGHERFCRRCGEHQFKDKWVGFGKMRWRSVWNYKEHGILEAAIWWFTKSPVERERVAKAACLWHKKCGGALSYDYIRQMYEDRERYDLR